MNGKGPYEFKPEDARSFARRFGYDVRDKGNELTFTTCPYCHSKKDKNTFSINMETGQYHCLRSSCGVSGNMIQLAQDFNFSLGQNTDEYYAPKRRYKVFKKLEHPIESKELAIAYLESRGISPETTRRYQVSSKDDLIAFAFLDEKGDVQTIKYRRTNPQDGQSKEFAEQNCKPILYGMYQCDLNCKTLVVTEGQIDSLSVAEAGIPNAVSVPTGARGMTWIPYCWNWVSQFERIIIFGDHEHDHITLYSEFYAHWKRKVWCVREEDYLDCKDANDILRKYGKEQVRKCVENASQPPIPQVISLADVEDVDVNGLEKLHTGLWQLDDVLNGGLPFGQLVLITGKSGDGKSTLANQILINGINEGYKCFAYSGELPNYLLKSWITFQAAGPNNILTMGKQWSGKKSDEYEVDGRVKEIISDWYRERAWIYDNRIADTEDEEQMKLMELLEAVIVQNEVRVILLDNLMTAMDIDEIVGNYDKYDRQSVFIKKLTRMAIKHNVLIILVAHKKKGVSDSNDSVSGSADIVNLASIVISYERPYVPPFEDMKNGEEALKGFLKKHSVVSLEEYKKRRILRVTKNRLFGSLTDENGLMLLYDEKSKRIYQSNGELNRRYNWDDSWMGAEDIVKQMSMPFDTGGDET